ncbi:MAG: ABC transporter substrate binding protein [Thermodesulfobacteriota bacterium]
MAGRRLLTSCLVLLALGQLLWPAVSRAGGVAVLLSDAEAAYLAPLAAFKSEMPVPVRTFDLGGRLDRAPQVMAELLASEPQLVFALGAKAAAVAKAWTSERPDLPVLFALVLNWQRYSLGGQANVAGIAQDVSPGVQFASATLVRAGVRRLGVLYNPTFSAETVAAAQGEAQALGLQLVARPLADPARFRQELRRLAEEVDALWVLPDPMLYSLEHLALMETECVRRRLPCVGPSRQAASAGLLLALDVDETGVGYQAAALARDLLAGRATPAAIGVRPPLATRSVLNLRTAREMGLKLDPAVMGLTSEIID